MCRSVCHRHHAAKCHFLSYVYVCMLVDFYPFLSPSTASEYRSWILFYSIPVLHGILDDTYLQHYILLIQAVWILLSDSSISDKQFANCEKLLHLFCLQFSAFYGELIAIKVQLENTCVNFVKQCSCNCYLGMHWELCSQVISAMWHSQPYNNYNTH